MTFLPSARRCILGLLLATLLLPGCVSFAPRKTDLPNGHVEIPVDTDLISPMVQATVNGRGPYTFELDTGASVLVISQWLADELKLPTKTSPYRLDDPKGRRSPARPLARVATLQVGRATFSDIRAVVDPLDHPWDTPHIAGVIGCAVLSKCRLTLDLTGREAIMVAWYDEADWASQPPAAEPAQRRRATGTAARDYAGRMPTT